MIILINLVLIGSTPLGKAKEDILYMDCILICVLGVIRFYDFLKWKRCYGTIEAIIEREGDVTHLPLEENYYIQLIKRIIRVKELKATEAQKNYEKSIDELQDYITKWVHDIKVNIAICDLVLQEIEVSNESTDTLILQVEKMKFMVNQILQVTRANHYNENIDVGEVDLQVEVRNAIKDNAQFFISKNIEIHTQIGHYRIVSDKKWIHYIFSQILNNSSKYTSQEGQVTLFTKEDEQAIYLYIRDNGIGIPKQDINRIFHKGFTGTNGSNTTKSTGMGLYYAKKMAERLSLGLEVEAEEGRYTQFVISFYKLRDYFKHKEMP